jgi:hypothetical protein
MWVNKTVLERFQFVSAYIYIIYLLCYILVAVLGYHPCLWLGQVCTGGYTDREAPCRFSLWKCVCARGAARIPFRGMHTYLRISG